MRAEQAALALTRFADSAIHQNVADERVTVSLSLTVDGGRTATAADHPHLRGRAGRPGGRDARRRPAAPARPGLARPGRPGADGVGGLPRTHATAAATPADRAAGVAAFVEAAGGL